MRWELGLQNGSKYRVLQTEFSQLSNMWTVCAYYSVGKTAADIGIFVGDATKATMVKPFKFFANAHVAILKVCPKGDWPTTFLDLTPSAFYDFASGDAPAKHIFFDTGKVKKLI